MARRLIAMLALALTAGSAQAKGKGGRAPAVEPPPPTEPAVAPTEPAAEAPADSPAAETPVEATPAESPAAETIPPDVGAALEPAPDAPATEAVVPQATTPPAAPAADSATPAAAAEPVPPEATPAPEAPTPAPAEAQASAPALPAADDPVTRSREAVTSMEVRAMVPALERQTLLIDVRPPGSPAAVIANGEVPEGASAPPAPADPREAAAVNEAPELVRTVVELPVRKRVLPDYPPELEVIFGEQAIRCDGVVEVDEKGKAGRAAVTCPAGFHLAALNALRGWRWEVPDEGLPEGAVVEVSLGFVRGSKPYRPGVSVLGRAEQVTGSLALPVLLKAGEMPKYPRNVNYGDDTCVVELVVDEKGRGSHFLVDECAPIYRIQSLKAVKRWSWYPAIVDGEAVERAVVVDLRFLLEQTPARLLGQ
jgi:hypothetical protein